MSLRTTGRSRERILVFGIEGTGKTRAFLSIVRAIPNVTHWILDNDNGVDRLLETEFSDLTVREEYKVVGGELEEDDRYTDPSGNIVLIHCRGWENHVAAVEYIAEHCDRDDWWLIDKGGKLWSDVQEWYIDTVHSLDMDAYLLDHRKRQKKAQESGDKKGDASTAEGMLVEWNFINPVYSKRFKDHTYNPPCHLFITADQADLSPRDKDTTTRDIYGSVNVKAQGQKELGKAAQTVLWVRKYQRGDGSWKWTTLKDRGRDELMGVELDDFAQDYLQEVAGWVSEPTRSGARTGTSTTSGPIAKKVSTGGVAKKIAKNSG